MAPSVPVEFAGQRESKKFSQTGMRQMMGKTRKVSKGYSSGFVPDYRHAVETMAESEGFGSSGRVETEITVSADSSAPKRKCVSLNGYDHDRYGVPVRLVSLSTMSKPEREDLELSLKSELEQIRVLQRKIASLSSGGPVLSPLSDIRSYSDEQKRPVPETSQRAIGAPAPQGKKRPPPGKGGLRAKQSAGGRFAPVKQALPSNTSNVMLMKQCETLLNRLMSHQHGWIFNKPVDVVNLNIPDYFTVIKHPMDLGTVKTRLTSGEYLNPMDFAADVRLTFSNAMTYNPRGNDVHFMAEMLSKFFEVRWKPIEKKIPVIVEAPAPQRTSALIEPETANLVPLPQKREIASVEDKVKQETPKPVMTEIEKHKLSTELEALLAELPDSIIDFLKEKCLGAGEETNEGEIELDIDTLTDDTLFTLRKLLDDYLVGKQKKQAKADTCEMELHNESGFSNSSVQPCKGTDPVDEDVDIGGNDLPISSFPPVEIQKDTVVRNSKCSSSSSSSSESGSSSSDSGSGSSSDSESDGAKASVPKVTAEETTGSGANLEQKTDEVVGPDAGNHSLIETSHIEQNTELKTVSVEADDRQEGESAPSERQVSPEKLYRAALLRSRFADTILKAQEKTLGKIEKQDAERLRLEREEVERRRKEEKARLQAEAKAAEEARRRAEAEAAAEAKRKRELEREAARQALQLMEKTVDINENCQFMEDLDMLRAAPAEQLESFIEEASPDCNSQDGLGSFKFQGSNPLEQLGLYMKADDDDEEEVEPESGPAVVDDDTEEGEID